MPLNKGQQAAEEAVFQFLLSNDKEFILSGPAGVGKTFMMKHIMDNLMTRYHQACKLLGMPDTLNTIHQTATTNKASEVLETSTGYPAQTIHSFMNLKVVDDFKTGISRCRPTPSWKVHSGIVLFIDEASMIDSDLHKHILEGTDTTCKIIYVGDHSQLAPVFEKVSPIYLSPKHYAELLEPVRNADQPALMALCDQFRDTVATLKFKPILEVLGVIDYIDDTKLQYILDNDFKDESIDSRILCFTNARVKDYNDYIRGVRGYPDHLVQGEIVINNSAVIIGKMMLRVEQQFKISKIDSTFTPYNIDEHDPSAIMDIYEAVLVSPNDPGTATGITVRIPANRDHYKALIDFYSKNKMWRQFYHLKNNYPDLRPKDAATVYKAQGSTYDSVILDLSNIGRCNQSDQVARMLYVGVSRPCNRLYLYGKLPPRYNQS